MLADEGANTLMWLDGDVRGAEVARVQAEHLIQVLPAFQVIDQSISMNMLVWRMPRLMKWILGKTIAR